MEATQLKKLLGVVHIAMNILQSIKSIYKNGPTIRGILSERIEGGLHDDYIGSKSLVGWRRKLGLNLPHGSLVCSDYLQ